MSKARKFRRGEVLTPEQTMARLLDGRWVYLWSTPKHPEVMLHMVAKNIIGFAKMGAIREAILNEELTT